MAAPTRTDELAMRRTAGLGAGRFAAAGLSLLWAAVVSRHVPVHEAGAFALASSLAVSLSILPDLGLPIAVTEAVTQQPEIARSAVARVVRRRLAVAVPTVAILVVLFRTGSPSTLWVPVLLAGSLVATTVHSTITAAYRGLGRVLPDSLNELLSRSAVLVVGWWWLHRGGGIVAAAAVLAAADVASAVVLGLAFRRNVPAGPPAPDELVRWDRTLTVAGSLILGALHARIDVWLLALLDTNQGVAHYAIPARLAEGLALPAGVAAALILPVSAQHTTDPRDRVHRALRYVGVIVALTAVGSTVVAANAEWFLRLVFGHRYASDGVTLQVLAVAALPAATVIALAPLAAVLRRGALLRAMGVAVAVNVTANLLLVPTHHGLGAAWATVISTSLLAVLLVIALLRSVRVPDPPSPVGTTPSTAV